jgi:hypothetical protein
MLPTAAELARAADEYRGWAGRLRKALGGADVNEAREALRQVVGKVRLVPVNDGFEDFLVARYDNAEIPLHKFLTAEWLTATGVDLGGRSIGSGGALC